MLAEALRSRRHRVLVHLIDISPDALEPSERTLGRFDHISVVGHRATYEEWPAARGARPPPGGHPAGDLPGVQHRQLRSSGGAGVRPRDPLRDAAWRRLLLGADLVWPEKELLLAYDDPVGVTAAFNKNLLARINTELLADFDLSAFDHRAVWNAEERRVEMHLISRVAQTVQIPRADCTVSFAAGEGIWTESSYKYRADEVVATVEAAGFHCHEQWIEPDARFALTLFAAQ
jgi:hypothetical protein